MYLQKGLLHQCCASLSLCNDAALLYPSWPATGLKTAANSNSSKSYRFHSLKMLMCLGFGSCSAGAIGCLLQAVLPGLSRLVPHVQVKAVCCPDAGDLVSTVYVATCLAGYHLYYCQLFVETVQPSSVHRLMMLLSPCTCCNK